MKSLLTITTPATSLALLTIAEMREAAGVADNSQDATLTALGLRVAASITTECNIAVGSGGEPTLLRETLTESFRSVEGPELILSRRHDVAITSIVEDTITLDADTYEVDPQTGLVMRLCNDLPIWWCARKVTVVYAAGFSTVPGDLKQAALDCLTAQWLDRERDPLVKTREVDIPDVRRERVDYWVGNVPGQSNDGMVPDFVAGQLTRFRNAAVG